jgi:hypothetical protein
MIIELMNKKEHLTMDGLQRIVSIRASMNNGLSDELKVAFPNIKPISRPEVESTKIPDPNWLAGFTEGEGCFEVKISKSKTSKTGSKVELRLRLAQHSRDHLLIKSLVQYFACGIYSESSSQGALMSIFTVTKFKDLVEKIIPFFDLFPLQGIKRLDYADFSKVANLMKNKAHLTQEGLDLIREIKAGMNTGRNNSQ